MTPDAIRPAAGPPRHPRVEPRAHVHALTRSLQAVLDGYAHVVPEWDARQALAELSRSYRPPRREG